MTSGVKRTFELTKWLDERLKAHEFVKFAEKKLVPVHKHSVWYYMGGIALMLMALQVGTGLLLMVYYIPGIDSAHASLLKLNTQVDFGWFFRSFHSWGANILILVLFAHMFSAYFMRAYRKPRELTWYTGLLLLAVVLGFGFSGYLLPWDTVSFFATKIGIDIASKLPYVGEQIAEILRGGSSIGQSTLSRFFVIHVALLPLIALGLMGVHLMLVQVHGMSEPKIFKSLADNIKQYERFFPNFMLKDVLVWLLALNALAFVVTLYPWRLGPEADPFAAAPIGIKPEWYFLAPFQFLKLMPPRVGPIEGELIGILLMLVVLSGLIIFPVKDTGENKVIERFATVYGVVLLLGIIIFTIWGALS
ncbi:MAG TPA: cytochrome b N-terminal domain-containing protein [Oculatellaceae cyanobacterium]